MQRAPLQQHGDAAELSSLPLHLSNLVSASAFAWSSQPPPPTPLGYHQGFLAAVLAFPLGPVLIWVISTSVKASGGRHERMRSMVRWYAALSCSRERIMCFILLSRERKLSTLVSSVWIFCRAAWRIQNSSSQLMLIESRAERAQKAEVTSSDNASGSVERPSADTLSAGLILFQT